MRLAVLLALAMLVSPIAGCLGSEDVEQDPASVDASSDEQLSPPRYDVRDVEEVWVEASDATQLHHAVYRPDTNESVPVFINFSPYWGDSAEEGGDAFAQYMIEEYVPRGYAVVLSAIRGTGHSEGCFQIGGDREVADLHEVVDRFANANWSNGNVIAGGKSYDSTTQNGLLAKDPHPALEGVFHVSGISDMYRYTYRAGVPYTHGPVFNTYYYGQGVHEYGAAGSPGESASYQDESPDSLARLVDDVACEELPREQANGIGSGAHGLKTDYWVERDWNRYAEDSGWNGSVFFVHGFQDWNVKPDHVLPWLAQLPEDVDTKGWLHQDVEDGTGHVYPMRTDWNETMLRWLDHVGKDKDTGVEWGFEAEGSDGVWRASDTWPPRAVDDRNLTLATQDASTEMDPANRTAEVPLDRAGDEPVRLAGAPAIRLTATSQTADPVLTAKLYKVDEDGNREWINEAIQRGTHRDGLEQPSPVPPGQPVTYELTFFPQDDVIHANETLELVLGDEPRFGIPLEEQVERVDYDAEVELTLPYAPTEPGLAEQPEPTNCFAC
jgi:predicted acyl esterase